MTFYPDAARISSFNGNRHLRANMLRSEEPGVANMPLPGVATGAGVAVAENAALCCVHVPIMIALGSSAAAPMKAACLFRRGTPDALNLCRAHLSRLCPLAHRTQLSFARRTLGVACGVVLLALTRRPRRVRFRN